MKVSVCANLTYDFTAEIPDNVKTPEDALAETDFADPAFQELTQVLTKHGINFNANIVSILKEDTNEELYIM